MRKPTLTLLAMLAVLMLVAAGCGGDDDDDGGSSDGAAQTESSGAAGNGADSTEAGAGGGGGATDLTLVADPSGALKFDKAELATKPGRVKITMENQSDVPHAVEIEGNGVEEVTDTVTGANADLTADLEPGEYRFYCPVGDHAEAGMEGTLTVR